MNVTAWRIVQTRRLPTAFSGEGAKEYPGRWNHRGFPMVYTAGSLSLAVIEMLVHLEATALLDLYVSIPLSFPRNLCKRLSLEDLPNDWTSDPAPMSTKDIGTSWLKSQESPVLAVPSSIVRIETCFLLNPCHPEFGRIEIGSAEEFRFDPRLLKEGRCY